MLVTDTDKRNRRNSYFQSDNYIDINIKSITKDAGPDPKIVNPTGSTIGNISGFSTDAETFVFNVLYIIL